MRYLFIILFFALQWHAAHATPCHPDSHPDVPQYIIGYGSLMSEQSKADTDASAGENIPILLKGFQRGWFDVSKHPGFGLIYLGVKVEAKSTLNGVLFKLANNQSIAAYDARELGYCRAAVKREDIKLLSSSPLADGEYWIYVLDKKDIRAPSQQYPIVQSYVDIFLSGCFELEAKYHLQHFAKECVHLTTNWSKHWVNDRVYARRAYNENPILSKIDNLLFEEVPSYFNAMTLD